MVSFGLNWSALYYNEYDGGSVNDELKGHKRIEESSPRDVLLDNHDQEQCEGYASKIAAHIAKRLLDVLILKCLDTSRRVKGCQVSSITSGNCSANERNMDYATYLGKR